MRYFNIEVVCGHVGKGKCVVKNLAVKAVDGKAAALIARNTPRVKHDLKEAVRKVSEVSYLEYLMIDECNSRDPFFLCKNVQEQRLLCDDLDVLPLTDVVSRFETHCKKDDWEYRYKKDKYKRSKMQHLVFDWLDDGPFAA